MVVWFCGSHFAFAGSAAGYSIRQRKPKAGHDNTKQRSAERNATTQRKHANRTNIKRQQQGRPFQDTL